MMYDSSRPRRGRRARKPTVRPKSREPDSVNETPLKFGTFFLELVSTGGTFRVPSPTTSDEEEIERLEKGTQNAELLSARANQYLQLGSTGPRCHGTSHLDSETSLSSSLKHPPTVLSASANPSENQAPASVAFAVQQRPAGMVTEREPPRSSLEQPSQPKSTAPVVFGRPSVPGAKAPTSSIFNVPKPNQPRPEHHRSSQPANEPRGSSDPRINSSSQQHDPAKISYDQGQKPIQAPLWTPDWYKAYRNKLNDQMGAAQQDPTTYPKPATSRPNLPDPDVVEIPKPTNLPTWNNQPRMNPQPTYSVYQLTAHGFAAAGYSSSRNVIDLTKRDEFDPDASLRNDQFGAPDPYLYLSEDKAAENIKALLEGTFEDEEDKPQTRSRKQKLNTQGYKLAERLKDLNVKSEENKENVVGKQVEDDDEGEVDDGTVEGLKVKLLPHQIEGVEWMKDKECGKKKRNGVLPKGGILADDMGLGKTIQSIALLLTNPRPSLSSSNADKNSISPKVGRNTLIVAPLALIKQWESEIRDKVSESHRQRVCVHHGPQRTKRFEDLKRFDIVITTYQILVSEYAASSPREDGPQAGCFGIHWYRVILDEAHSIKNRNAKASQACYALRSEYRWCLTGTPMQNNLDELQSLIRFLRIKPYDELHVWKDQITRPMNQGRGGIAIKRLQYYLKAFMKRRTKDILKKDGALNVGGKNGDKDGQVQQFRIVERKVLSVSADFSEEERKFYNRLEQRVGKSLDELIEYEGMNYASALVLLLRLRQACNHPKLLGATLSKDKDALTTGQNVGQSPKKSRVDDKDVDDMADLLGGLSVESRKCDVCQKRLSNVEVSDGLTRCDECEDDQKALKDKKHRRKKNSGSKKSVNAAARPRGHAKKILTDDSDDDGEGEWLVPHHQGDEKYLGKAGGTDDENAEGEGETLNSSDTDTDHEEITRHRSKPKARVDSSIIEIPDSEPSSESSSESDSEFSYDRRKPSPATSAKVRRLLEILQSETPKYKTIVYSQFTSMLDLIEPHLKARKLTYTRYDGSMRNDAREASLAALRSTSRSSPRILLCSLKCGSLGLNLTAASRVVILEPFWNPFVEEQAIDRVHRLNQTVDVVVYKLTVPDTVEGRIVELQERKRELAAQTIEATANAGSQGKGGKGAGKGKNTLALSMKDILQLFGRDAELADHGPSSFGAGRGEGVLHHGGTTGGSSAGGGILRPGGVSESRIGNHHGGGAAKKAGREDPIYGRRW